MWCLDLPVDSFKLSEQPLSTCCSPHSQTQHSTRMPLDIFTRPIDWSLLEVVKRYSYARHGVVSGEWWEACGGWRRQVDTASDARVSGGGGVAARRGGGGVSGVMRLPTPPDNTNCHNNQSPILILKYSLNATTVNQRLKNTIDSSCSVIIWDNFCISCLL